MEVAFSSIRLCLFCSSVKGFILEIDFIFGDVQSLVCSSGHHHTAVRKCQCISGWFFLHELLKTRCSSAERLFHTASNSMLVGCVDKGLISFFIASSFGYRKAIFQKVWVFVRARIVLWPQISILKIPAPLDSFLLGAYPNPVVISILVVAILFIYAFSTLICYI